MESPVVHEIFEPSTGTWQYVVADPSSSSAVVIDPVLNYNSGTGEISSSSANMLLKVVAEQSYKVDMILETHAHADHITAASYLKQQLAKTQEYAPLMGIGKRIRQIQKLFGGRYGVPAEAYEGVFDKLWEDDEVFMIGKLPAQALHLPGHTPDHMGYKIGDNVFVGDSVFNVDLGSARADFPGGSAEAIFNSGRRLFALPDHTKIWVGHDYPPEGRDAPMPFMTVKEHKEKNKHLRESVGEQEFVTMRRSRDATLAEPRLIHPSLQMNIRGGRLPVPTANGDRFVQVPLKLKDLEWEDVV